MGLAATLHGLSFCELAFHLPTYTSIDVYKVHISYLVTQRSLPLLQMSSTASGGSRADLLTFTTYLPQVTRFK